MPKDSKPAPPPEVVEPEPDTDLVPIGVVDPETDEGDDLVQLVRSGWVRFRWSGETIRLRRPFFGELKTLRLALEDASDAISDASEEIQLTAARLVEKGTALDADADIEAGERVKQRRALQRESRDAGRKLTDIAEEERLRWWALVFATLTTDDPPDQESLPSWIVDVNLPNTVMQHWRSVPLARG